ncbi:MAG TPA: hypothetical protein VK835_10630 [Bacteroidia bacterium]|nr:hypothetical protein [Bacteroidia bacterium]
MKRLNPIHTILFLLLPVFCFCQKTDWEKDHLIGRVKQVNLQFKSINTKGNYVGFSSYNQNGSLTTHVLGLTRDTFIYDVKGNLITLLRYVVNATSLHYHRDTVTDRLVPPVELRRKYTYKYDDNGNRTEETCCQKNINSISKDSVVNKTKYLYDGAENLIEKNLNDSNLRWLYKYNTKGNLIEQCRLSANKIKSKFTYVYDTSGYQIERYVYKKGNKLKSKTTYAYDDKGNKAEENFSKQTDDESNNKASKKTYKYDSYGNIIEIALYKADKSLKKKTIFNYEYDKYGNWTKKSVIANGEFTILTNKVSSITTREFIYY